MTVEHIMIDKVVTIAMDDTLQTIKDIFMNVKFHHLFVVENGVLVGIISDRDYLYAVSPFVQTMSERPSDLGTLKKKAHQIMSRKPIAVRRNTALKEAATLLLEHRVSCLPVTTSDGKLEGVITWKDLLKYYLDSLM